MCGIGGGGHADGLLPTHRLSTRQMARRHALCRACANAFVVLSSQMGALTSAGFSEQGGEYMDSVSDDDE